MYGTTLWASLAVIGLLVGGCSSGSGDADSEDVAEDVAEDIAENAADNAAADETVFDDMLETQDRARAVEDLNDERRESLESAIEPGENAEAADDHSER